MLRFFKMNVIMEIWDEWKGRCKSQGNFQGRRTRWRTKLDEPGPCLAPGWSPNACIICMCAEPQLQAVSSGPRFLNVTTFHSTKTPLLKAFFFLWRGSPQPLPFGYALGNPSSWHNRDSFFYYGLFRYYAYFFSTLTSIWEWYMILKLKIISNKSCWRHLIFDY